MLTHFQAGDRVIPSVRKSLMNSHIEAGTVYRVQGGGVSPDEVYITPEGSGIARGHLLVKVKDLRYADGQDFTFVREGGTEREYAHAKSLSHLLGTVLKGIRLKELLTLVTFPPEVLERHNQANPKTVDEQLADLLATLDVATLNSGLVFHREGNVTVCVVRQGLVDVKIGVARKAPDDVDNEAVGKLIALMRALGKEFNPQSYGVRA